MIDKVIHQIWVGPYDIPEREVKLYKEIRDKHPDWVHMLWTDSNLPDIPERLQPMYDKMYSKKDYAYCADMLRWLVVCEYGGWYLDIDFEYVKNLNDLGIDHRDGLVFGHWGEGWQHCDYTIPNGIFAFKKKHPMVQFIVNELYEELEYQNAPYPPCWAGLNCKKYMGLENEFSNEIWEYHRIMKEHLDKHNIEYGDYNVFQNENFRHHALYSWGHKNKILWEQGLIK